MDAVAAVSRRPAYLTAALLPAVHALSRYWKPFLLIQFAALCLVLAHYLLPHVAAVLAVVGEWRNRGGVLAAALAGAVAGGLLPEIAKLLTGTDHRPPAQRLHDTAFNLAFFAISSTVVYYFYLLQSHLFGDTPDFATVAKKVAVDQLLFTVFWATPFGLVMFTLKACHYSLPRVARALAPRHLKLRVPSLLLPCWAFWIPMTTLIYCLPAELQFALFSLALAAWSLLVVFIAQRPAAH